MRWLVVGGLAALVALVVLWQLTQGLTEPITPAPIAQGTAAPVEPEASAPNEPTVVKPRRARMEPPVVRIPGKPGIDPTPAPALEPSVEVQADRAQDVGKQMRSVFRKQVDLIDPYAAECVARANNRGAKLTGRAALTIVMEYDREHGRVMVTDVGVEPIDTNIEDVALLTCLRDSGRRMQLDALPEGVSSIQATHEVTLDGGAITNHKLSAMQMTPVAAP